MGHEELNQGPRDHTSQEIFDHRLELEWFLWNKFKMNKTPLLLCYFANRATCFLQNHTYDILTPSENLEVYSSPKSTNDSDNTKWLANIVHE